MKKIVKIAAVILMAVCSIRFVQCYGLSSKSAVDLETTDRGNNGPEEKRGMTAKNTPWRNWDYETEER